MKQSDSAGTDVALNCSRVSTPDDSTVSGQTENPRAVFPSPPSILTPALDPNNPPWGLLQASLTWVASVVLLWLIPQLCALPYVASHYRGMAGPTKEMLLNDRTFILIIVSGILPAHLLTLVLAWAVATRLGKFPVTRVLGLNRGGILEILVSSGLALFLLGLSALIIYKFGGQETDLEKILRSSRAAALITAVIAGVTAPLIEEVIYRGLLYSALQRLAGPIAGVLVVSSMFAGLHVLQYWPNFGAISAISLLSLTLTVVRARTGRLLPCYIIHLVFNGIQSVIIVVDPYLRSFYDGSQHDATVGTLGSLFKIF